MRAIITVFWHNIVTDQGFPDNTSEFLLTKWFSPPEIWNSPTYLCSDVPEACETVLSFPKTHRLGKSGKCDKVIIIDSVHHYVM